MRLDGFPTDETVVKITMAKISHTALILSSITDRDLSYVLFALRLD
jgi:hypothetical protein